jgi:hypothetical protein
MRPSERAYWNRRPAEGGLAISGRKRDPVGDEFPAFRYDIPRSLFSVSLWVPLFAASTIGSCARLDAYTSMCIHAYSFHPPSFFHLSFQVSSVFYYSEGSIYHSLGA